MVEPVKPGKGVILLTTCLDLIGFGIVIPLLPAYANSFDISDPKIGLIMAAYSFMQFVCAPMWGHLSDRIGRRPVLLATIPLTGVCYLLCGFATSFATLLAARLAAGFFGANLSVAQAYMADVTPREDRARGMALIGMAFGVGFSVGPALGAIAWSWGRTVFEDEPLRALAMPFFVAGGIGLLNSVWALFALRESLPEEKRRGNGPGEDRPGRFDAMRRAWGLPALRALLLLAFLGTFAFANFETTLTRFLQDIHGLDVEIAKTFAFIGVVLVLSQGLYRGLVRRAGEGPMLAAGMLLMTIGLAALPWTPTGLLLVPLCVLSMGNGWVHPSISAMVSMRTPANLQGGTFGITQSVASIARIVGPLIGLSLFDMAPRSPHVLAAVLLAVATIWATRVGGADAAAKPALD